MNLLDDLISESREISRLRKRKASPSTLKAKTPAAALFLSDLVEKERQKSLSQLEAAREYLRGWRPTHRIIVISETICQCGEVFTSPGATSFLLRRTNTRTGDIWESPIESETPKFLSELPLLHRTLTSTVKACHLCHPETPPLQTDFAFTQGLRPYITRVPGPAQRIRHYV